MSGKAQNAERAFNPQPRIGLASGPSRVELLVEFRLGVVRPLPAKKAFGLRGALGLPVWSVSYSDLMLWPVPDASFLPKSRPLLHLTLLFRQVRLPGSSAGLCSPTGSCLLWLSSLCSFTLVFPVFPPRPTKPQKYIFGAQAEIVVQAWGSRRILSRMGLTPPTPVCRFSGSQHCGHIHCAYQYREHYHCLDPECNYQVWAILHSPASMDTCWK